VINADVAQTKVLDLVTGNAADDRGVLWFGVVGDDIADNDAACLADGHRVRRSAVSFSKADEDRGICDVAHRDVGDGHVFERGSVDTLERETAAVVKNAIRDRNVLKSAVRFGAEFYAARRAEGAVGGAVIALIGTIEQSAFVVTANLAVGDCD